MEGTEKFPSDEKWERGKQQYRRRFNLDKCKVIYRRSDKKKETNRRELVREHHFEINYGLL